MRILVLLVLLRSGQALAGEQLAIAAAPFKPELNMGPAPGREPMSLSASMFDLPRTYQPIDVAAGDPAFSRDFRPHGPSVLQLESPAASREDLPMLYGTSVWQRLADYRSHGRVRLLTLWETGGSSVSLQAGKKGEPSLQWTSRSMNRGGATRGLFDQWVSMAAANRSAHQPPHPGAIEPAVRPGKPLDVLPAGANNK